MKKLLIYSLTVLLLCSISVASSFVPLPLKDLKERSTHIVVGKIIKIEEMSSDEHTGTQKVHLRVAFLLKGKAQGVVSFNSNYKGLVDFDPKFTVGKRGVFFLKKNKSQYSLSHFGSAAVFEKDTFKD